VSHGGGRSLLESFGSALTSDRCGRRPPRSAPRSRARRRCRCPGC
jgi:hypothetical protein